MLEEVVEDYELFKDMSADELVLQMEKAWGFTAGKLAVGVKILEKMVNDDDCVKFLSFPANIVATGTRGALKELVKRKFIDVAITTCGTLDHDIARCWKPYFKGSFLMDDEKLRERNINRLGNVLVPNESYGVIIEKKMRELLQNIWDEGVREISTSQLCQEIGKRICNESSILHWATKQNIPVYVPGITDGAVGYQLWLFSQDHDFKINLLKDEGELNDLVFTAKKTGALIVGGGISKHHTLWWNQFKDGLDYAVYISTAVEWDGSLSGARPREAVSWHKIKQEADHVMIEGDASVILPIMVSSLITRKTKQK
ncbi:MAG: deoxyhypusine synthase [Candidatus Bathyarchaeia archaeon]|nr:deoxyhypusine synthase [Candidatus Bathyarchaeia archaeon]